MCLGFDIPERGVESLLFQVTYNTSRLQFVLDHAKDLMGIDQAFIQTLISTKSQEWSYEREYRAIANLDVRDPATGYYYVDFGPELRLREVILGSRNQTPVGQVAKRVKGNLDSVLVYKARPAFQKFEMVRNKSVSAISVKPRT
jgi:hypothetical protein